MPETNLAVVVIGRNEGNRLAECLKSVKAAQLPRVPQLIYVDSNSTDGSPALAENFGAKVIRLGSGKLSAARARNAGWMATDADAILFLDGDTLLHPDFVREALKEFQDPRVAVVWGHRRESRPEKSLYNRVLDLDWIYAPGPSEFCGGDALMRRTALEEVDGFEADLIAGEEPDLCRRLRALDYLILHIDRPMTLHDLAIVRFSQYWRRAVRAGHAYAEVAEKYRDSPDKLWSNESQANIRRASFFLAAGLGLCAVSITFKTFLPLLVGLLGFAGLALRTALSSRWKGAGFGTLVLFGFHSHLQQIPILEGQLLYFWGRWRNHSSTLIEYNTGSKLQK